MSRLFALFLALLIASALASAATNNAKVMSDPIEDGSASADLATSDEASDSTPESSEDASDPDLNTLEGVVAVAQSVKEDPKAAAGVIALAAASQAASKAVAYIQDCANGVGPLASLQAGCQLIQQGISVGGALAKMLDLQINPEGCPGTCVQVTVDLSSWFGVKFPPTNLLMVKSSNGISMKITIVGGYNINFGALLKAAIPNGWGFGDIAQKLIENLYLGQIDILINEIAVNVKPFGVRVSGALKMFGKQLNFDILMGKLVDVFVFALDISAAGSAVNGLIDGVLGPVAPILNPFNFIRLDFTISTASVDLSRYDTLAWGGTDKVLKGLTFASQVSFSASSTNPLFQILSKVFGNTVFILSVNFDGSSLTASLLLSDIKIGPVTLSDIGFFIQAKFGVPPALVVGMQGSIAFPVGKDELKFTAKVSVNVFAVKLQLSLQMTGIWRNVFGLPISIGNLYGAIGLMAQQPWVTSLALGGSLWIGPVDDPNSITGTIFISLDLNDYKKNCFYGNVSRLVVGQFLSIVFGIKNIPAFLANTGFPTGLYLSYSIEDNYTPFNVFIPGGFHFKGSVNMFDIFKGEAEMILSVARNYINVELGPINFGVFKLVKSKAEQDKGAKLMIDIQMSPFKFKGSLNVYAKCFIFESNIQMSIDMSKFEFELDTTIFYIFTAHVHVKAVYVNPFKPDFAFEASISTDPILSALRAAILSFKATVTSSFDSASRALSQAQDAVYAKANQVRQGCLDKCGFQCNLLELGADAELIVAPKSHSLFQVSVEEMMVAQQWADVYDMMQMSEQEMLDAGIMVDDATAHASMLESGVDHTVYQRFYARDTVDVDEHLQMALLLLELSEASDADIAAMSGTTLLEVQAHMATRLGWPNWGAVGKAFTNIGNTIKNGIVSAAKTVAKAVVSVGKAIVNGLCQGGKAVCQGGCSVAGGVISLGGDIVGVAKGAVDLAKSAVTGFLSLMDTILGSFGLNIQVAGGLNTQQFYFSCKFDLRLGSFHIKFSLSINFKIAAISDFVASLWDKVKTYFLSKIPGLGALVGGDTQKTVNSAAEGASKATAKPTPKWTKASPNAPPATRAAQPKTAPRPVYRAPPPRVVHRAPPPRVVHRAPPRVAYRAPPRRAPPSRGGRR